MAFPLWVEILLALQLLVCPAIVICGFIMLAWRYTRKAGILLICLGVFGFASWMFLGI